MKRERLFPALRFRGVTYWYADNGFNHETVLLLMQEDGIPRAEAEPYAEHGFVKKRRHLYDARGGERVP